MGYFDGLTDALFKVDTEGRDVFYPFGVMGSGKVIPSQEAKDSLRTMVKRYYIVMLSSSLIMIMFHWYITAIGWAIASMFPFYALIYYKVSSYPKAQSKLTLTESYTNSANSHSPISLWLGLIFSILFVLLGVLFILFRGKDLHIGFISVGFFGLIAFAFGKMIKLRKK